MSWSATPGAGKHLSTSDGRFVKNKSSVALCLVGKLTICSRPQATARRNKPISRKIYLWKRADMDALRRGCTELATTFCQTFNTTSPIQDIWTFN
jgi:hypothetical protein